MKQLRATAMTTGLPERTKSLPVWWECGAFGKWEGDGAGRKTTMVGAARKRSTRKRSTPQLECDEQSLTIVLADRASSISGVLGNSYVMGHGSYPR